MCKNIGFGTMSTNSKMEFDSDLSSEKIKIKKIDLQEFILGYKELVKFYSKNAKKFKIRYYKFRIVEKVKIFLGFKY